MSYCRLCNFILQVVTFRKHQHWPTPRPMTNIPGTVYRCHYRFTHRTGVHIKRVYSIQTVNCPAL